MRKFIRFFLVTMSFTLVTPFAFADKISCTQAASDSMNLERTNDAVIFRVGSSSQSMKAFVLGLIGQEASNYSYFEVSWRKQQSGCSLDDASTFAIFCKQSDSFPVKISVEASEWRYQQASPKNFLVDLDSIEIDLSVNSLEDKVQLQVNGILGGSGVSLQSKFFEYKPWIYDGRRQNPECKNNF